MHQSSEKPRKQHLSAAKGLGYYPLTDMQFDVVNVVAEKSRALQHYDKYLRDSQANPELMEIFEAILADDRRHIEELKSFLAQL